MASALRRIGVAVTTEFDADRVVLTEALRAFPRQSAGADVSLDCYAGHGLEMNGIHNLLQSATVDVRFDGLFAGGGEILR